MPARSERAPAAWRLTGRTLRLPLSTGGAVLCFHSITTADAPSASSMHVALGSLEAAIDLARWLGEIVPLRELAERHQAGKSTAGLSAFTFDDAYAALLGPARDVLRRERVPATVFVTTRAAETGATFWWDRLGEAAALVPASRWRAFHHACGVPEAYLAGHPAESGPTRAIRQWLLAEHLGRWPEQLEPALAALEREAGSVTVHRSMDYAGLARLAGDDLVDFGVHTLTHAVLPLLPDEALREEVRGSHLALRERFGNVVPLLAFPFGLLDRRSVRLAREEGMSACFSLAETTLGPASPRDEIPRICMSRERPGWKLGILMSGLGERVRTWTRALPEPYPPLPSSTT